MDPATIQALTFDCYGTLVDWESGILTVLRPWARREGLAVDDDALLHAFAEAEPRCEEASPRSIYPEILRAVQGRIAEAFGRTADPAAADVLAKSVGEWPPFADTAQALRRLAARFRLAVISNIDRASFARTNQLLGVRFDAVITAEEVGVYKPDPRMFQRAFEVLDSIGIPREGIVHVAQSLYHDHAPARALGLRTVWVDRRHGRAGQGATPPAPAGVTPDLTVTTLEELANRLGA
jgi:2-haloacid dehalogenase